MFQVTYDRQWHGIELLCFILLGIVGVSRILYPLFLPFALKIILAAEMNIYYSFMDAVGSLRRTVYLVELKMECLEKEINCSALSSDGNGDRRSVDGNDCTFECFYSYQYGGVGRKLVSRMP
jgi:hypothetical protein